MLHRSSDLPYHHRVGKGSENTSLSSGVQEPPKDDDIIDSVEQSSSSEGNSVLSTQ